MILTEHLKQQSTWLITGVAGFIGSNLLEALLKNNQKVVGIDNFYTGHAKNLETVLSGLSPAQQKLFTFHEGDICSKDLCQQAMQGVNYVLHQAALSSIPKSIKEVELTHQINTNGFFNILFAAREAGAKRVVYASSCSVYGNANSLPNIETQAVDILSPYNATKYIDEIYASTFSICYGLETVGLRYFNIYGPRQEAHGAYAAVITRWIDELLNHKQTYIHDDHEQSRDFCYVDDVVAANILAATTSNQAALNTVYNIASGQESNLRTVYELIITALNSPDVKPISEPSTQGELEHSFADISKAQQLLGYQPQFTIQEGVPKLVANLLELYE